MSVAHEGRTYQPNTIHEEQREWWPREKGISHLGGNDDTQDGSDHSDGTNLTAQSTLGQYTWQWSADSTKLNTSLNPSPGAVDFQKDDGHAIRDSYPYENTGSSSIVSGRTRAIGSSKNIVTDSIQGTSESEATNEFSLSQTDQDSRSFAWPDKVESISSSPQHPLLLHHGHHHHHLYRRQPDSLLFSSSSSSSTAAVAAAALHHHHPHPHPASSPTRHHLFLVAASPPHGVSSCAPATSGALSAVSLCARSLTKLPLKLLIIIDPVQLESTGHVYWHLDLGCIRSRSLSSLLVAYSIPLLCLLTPRLVLPLGIFQVLSLIASHTSSLPTNPEDGSSPFNSMDIALATHQPPRSSPSPSGQQDTPSNTLLSPSSASSSSASMTAMSSLSSPTSSTTVAQSATSSSSTSSSTPSMWSASNEDPRLFATLPQQRMPRPPVLPRLVESGEGSTAHYAHAFTSQPPPASSQPQPQHYHHLQQHQQHQHQFQQHQPPHHHHHDDMEGDEDEEEEDEYDEENRSDTSDTNEHRPHEVEFWLQRCSICFDARLDFCLEHCRDQFCRDCFQRYVKEVVNNSWGLNVTKIKCPVCQDVIPQSEWEKYVDAPTLALYRQFNQPYRSFSRYCDDCGHEVVVSSVNQALLEGRIRHPNNLINPLVVTLQRILALAGYATAFTPNVQGGTKKFKNTQMAQMNEAKELLERFHIGCKRVFEHTGVSASRLPRVAQSYLTSFARSSGFSLLSPSTHPSNSSQSSDATQPEGVLEIYRDVMSGVLDLLNLHLEDEHPSLGKRLRQDVDPKEIETDYLSDDESVTSEDDMYAHQESQTSNSLSMSEPQVASDHDTSNVEPSGLPLVVTFTLSPEKGYRPLPKALNVMTRSQRKRRAEILRALVKFSKELISLETRQEQWKELQFLHVRWLRWDWCGNCEREVCLQCGEGTHHEPHTCYEYMKRISENHSIDTLNSRKSKRLKRSRDSTTATTATAGSAGKGKAIVSSDSQDDQDGDDMSAKTMRWKLLNTNPCPNCCILIHRDDGCNKVDCLLCGYRFCWLCRETWGSECGFFRCKRQKNNPDASVSDSVMSESVTSTSGPSTESRTKSSEDIVPALGITDLSGDVGSHSPVTPEQTIVLSQHPKVMDKPEIGVPNVYVIQAKRSRK